MKDIYIIVWTGRDDESGVWDTYPCFNYGYFTDKDEAKRFANYIDNHEPAEWDDDAQDYTGYSVKPIQKHLGEY